MQQLEQVTAGRPADGQAATGRMTARQAATSGVAAEPIAGVAARRMVAGRVTAGARTAGRMAAIRRPAGCRSAGRVAAGRPAGRWRSTETRPAGCWSTWCRPAGCRRQIQRDLLGDQLKRLGVPALFQPDDADVVPGLSQLRVEPQRLPVRPLRQVEQPQPGGHQAEHQVPGGLLRVELHATPRRVQRPLPVAHLGQDRGGAGQRVRVVRCLPQDPLGGLGRVGEPIQIGEGHAADDQRGQVVRGGGDRGIGRRERLRRLAGGEADPGQRGQRPDVVRLGRDQLAQLASGVLVAPQVGEQLGALQVLVGARPIRLPARVL